MKRCLMVMAGILVLVLSSGSRASQVTPLTSDALAKLADVIFVGTCQNRVVKDGPPAAIEYTFKVETVVKGTVPTDAPFVLRQAGGAPTSLLARSIRVPVLWRMPDYEVGKTYMLFMGAANKDGLRAPVGGGQGVLLVSQSADGTSVAKQLVLNNRFLHPSQTASPAGTTKSVLTSSPSGGALQLNDFIQTIRKASTPGVAP